MLGRKRSQRGRWHLRKDQMGGLLSLRGATGFEKNGKAIEFSTVQWKQRKRIPVLSEASNCISGNLLYLLQHHASLEAVLHAVSSLGYFSC